MVVGGMETVGEGTPKCVVLTCAMRSACVANVSLQAPQRQTIDLVVSEICWETSGLEYGGGLSWPRCCPENPLSSIARGLCSN